MRFPNESLDEYKARKLKKLDPPVAVTLEFTGETEVLKPLAYWEDPTSADGSLTSVFHRLSWFHQSLIMGGVMTFATFLLGTGLYFVVYGPPVDPDANLAIDQQQNEVLVPADEPVASDLVATENPPSVFEEADLTPSVRKGIRERVRDRRSVYRVRSAQPLLRQWLHPEPWVSQFVPTTQFIYVENGVVRTRTEPQASFRRPFALPN
jgi:hypothetical protein